VRPASRCSRRAGPSIDVRHPQMGPDLRPGRVRRPGRSANPRATAVSDNVCASQRRHWTLSPTLWSRKQRRTSSKAQLDCSRNPASHQPVSYDPVIASTALAEPKGVSSLLSPLGLSARVSLTKSTRTKVKKPRLTKSSDPVSLRTNTTTYRRRPSDLRPCRSVTATLAPPRHRRGQSCSTRSSRDHQPGRRMASYTLTKTVLNAPC
jgi:hypothetical protein